MLEFMDTVRTTEHAIAAGRRGEDVPEQLDIASIGDVDEEEWRAYWPCGVEAEGEAEVEVEPDASDTEPAPDRSPEPSPADVPEPAPVVGPAPEESGVPEPGPVDVPEPSPQDGSVGAASNGNGVELQDQEVIVETR